VNQRGIADGQGLFRQSALSENAKWSWKGLLHEFRRKIVDSCEKRSRFMNFDIKADIFMKNNNPT